MYGKALFFVVLVIVGAVLPYLLADEKWLADIESRFKRRAEDPSAEVEPAGEVPADLGAYLAPAVDAALTGETPQAASPWPYPTGEGAATSAPRSSPVIGPQAPLELLLTFEATPDWISSHWSRVSTRLAELQLQGWRVPLARRDGTWDFAGSLTYYFDPQRRVQRIVLHGYSRDPRPFVQLATTRYQMKRSANRMGDLYTAAMKGQTVGALLVQYASVAEQDAQRRSELLLELNRQGSPYGTSGTLRQLLGQVSAELSLFQPSSASPP